MNWPSCSKSSARQSQTIDRTHLYSDQFFETRADVVARFGPHQQVEILDAGATSQQLLDQNFAHKAGGSRDEDRTIPIKSRYVGVDHFRAVLRFCL